MSVVRTEAPVQHAEAKPHPPVELLTTLPVGGSDILARALHVPVTPVPDGHLRTRAVAQPRPELRHRLNIRRRQIARTHLPSS
jgi:hypothetical protein